METLDSIQSNHGEDGRDADAIALLAAKSEAEALTGTSLGRVGVRSVNEMGRAAGLCHMVDGNIELRSDIVGDHEAPVADDIVDQSLLTSVLVHELLHRGKGGRERRIWAEGVVDLRARRLTQHRGAEDYDHHVRAAEKIETVLGGEEVMLAAAEGPDWQRNMTQQLVGALLEQGLEANRAINKAETLVDQVN